MIKYGFLNLYKNIYEIKEAREISQVSHTRGGQNFTTFRLGSIIMSEINGDFLAAMRTIIDPINGLGHRIVAQTANISGALNW